jgi:hypothetical protein
MFPLHSGHGVTESVVVLALALVVVAAAFALTREGWSRVGALVGVGVGAGVGRLGVAVVGVHGDAGHLLGHGLELSAVVVLALAGYYALFDARAVPVDG